MTNFILVIRGELDSTLPPLSMFFTMGSLHLAKLYAKNTSLAIANHKYHSFALFKLDPEQELVQEWTVSLIPTIMGDSANDC